MKSPLVDYIIRDLFQLKKWEKVPPLSLELKDKSFDVVPGRYLKNSPIKPMNLGLSLSKGGRILTVESMEGHSQSSEKKEDLTKFSRVFDLGEDTRILKMDIKNKRLDLVGDFTVYL